MTYRSDEHIGLDRFETHERLAFGKLLRSLVAADRTATGTERQALDDLAAELGEADFWDMVEQARMGIPSSDELRALAASVERQPVRNLIYESLYAVAMADTISEGEMSLLEELRVMWGVAVTPLED